MRIWVPLSLLTCLVAAGAAPPAFQSLREAQAQYLESYDAQEDARDLAIPKLSPKDRPAMQWLAGAATQAIPANPFRKGSPAWREAESLRRLLVLPTDAWPRALESQNLALSGSRLAFWRWGQSRVRDGRIGTPLRQKWEDKLLVTSNPDLLCDYALRHALCFALADADEARFAQLKDRWSAAHPDLFLDFQRAFALLGSPSPVFHFWKLPELNAVELSLQALGSHRIWIALDHGKGLPDLPPGTVWVVPTQQGLQPEGQQALVEPSLSEARSLAAKLQEAGRSAFLAPIRKPFETYAFMYFPILLELDEGGIHKIRMGDAALMKGH